MLTLKDLIRFHAESKLSEDTPIAVYHGGDQAHLVELRHLCVPETPNGMILCLASECDASDKYVDIV